MTMLKDRWNSREGRVSLVTYAVAAIISLIAASLLLHLESADLNIPFHYNTDTLLNCATVKNLMEGGWTYVYPHLGAPHPATLYDFPLPDLLNNLFIKLISVVAITWGWCLNIVFLLSFPLITVTSIFALRRLGITRPTAVVCGLLYAFLPYHFWRGVHHLYLGLYYLLPLIVLVCLWLGDGDRPVLWLEKAGRWRISVDSTRFGASVLVCAALSVNGVYYALFGAILLGCVGLLTALRRRALFPILGAGVLMATICFGLLLATMPNRLYQRSHGPNPEAVTRQGIEAEFYGLKISQLVLPVTGHRLPVLARWKEKYNKETSLNTNENDNATLGLPLTVGFALLLAVSLGLNALPGFPARQTLADLNLSALLIATVGGLGAISTIWVPAYLRDFNRMSVYIAFFAVIALAAALDALIQRFAATPERRPVAGLLLGVVLLVGLFDQTTEQFVPPYQAIKNQYDSDAVFVHSIESSLPSGSMVFQLPYHPFPEGGYVNHVVDYEPLRMYLHSKTLHWSYAAIKGREDDLWQREVSQKPMGEMLDALRQAGFKGVVIDRNSFTDANQAQSVEGAMGQSLNHPPVYSPDGEFVYFPL